MKLIIRADDVGYSQVCNIGAFKTIEEGVVTSADVMLDCPGTEDALRRLKDLPWISVGWHDHFWGAPVLDPDKVPSLYDKKRRGFREDLRTADDVSFDEALAECRAQIDRCIRILGRAPDNGGMGSLSSSFNDAQMQVCEEYGMAHNYQDVPECFRYLMGDKKKDPKWAHVKIDGSLNMYAALETDSLTQLETYDPLGFFLRDEAGILNTPEDHAFMTPFHPGYLDYFVYRQGDFGPNARKFLLCRIQDVHALTSPELKAWIREHNIELVGVRDVLYGTQYYQNYLRATGSDLLARK